MLSYHVTTWPRLSRRQSTALSSTVYYCHRITALSDVLVVRRTDAAYVAFTRGATFVFVCRILNKLDAALLVRMSQDHVPPTAWWPWPRMLSSSWINAKSLAITHSICRDDERLRLSIASWLVSRTVSRGIYFSNVSLCGNSHLPERRKPDACSASKSDSSVPSLMRPSPEWRHNLASCTLW